MSITFRGQREHIEEQRCKSQQLVYTLISIMNISLLSQIYTYPVLLVDTPTRSPAKNIKLRTSPSSTRDTLILIAVSI